MTKPVIVFEDNHLIVAVKPAGFLSQADGSGAPDMLTWLKAYLKVKYDKKGEVFLGLVHRLDRPVAGIMVFAKTSKAAARLSDQIRKKEFQKTYLTVCLNPKLLHLDAHSDAKPREEIYVEELDRNLQDNEVWCEDYLLKDNRTNLTKIVSADNKQGKLARLIYEPLATSNTLIMLKVTLLTGRSHQIRVQLSSRQLPIWGDARYGNRSIRGDIALYAYQLTLKHPITKENITFEAPYPRQKPFNSFEIYGRNNSYESSTD